MAVHELHGAGMTSQRTRDRLVQTLHEQGIADLRVLEAVRSTPRHIFVDEALASRAYENTALPIGHNQTVSQPYVVARMTEAALAGQRPQRVLEVGTGSGYQTAILSMLAETVYSLERINALLRKARERLRALGHRNVVLRHSDGTWGWADKGPYDAIVVTAAPAMVPEELFSQLAEGGRLVIPVGAGGSQELRLYQRVGNEISSECLDLVRFVPLLGGMD